MSVGSDRQEAVTFFRFDDAGMMREITDFWPAPYAGPARPDGVLDTP